MSGHSKWSTIKNKKDKADKIRSRIFTKLSREIAVAVKIGNGTDPEKNSKLKDAILKAKANNLPNDNIERIIKKAAGEGEKKDFFSIKYEGYGPEGVAILVEVLTDNKNRTASNVRHYFDKFGGKLGSSGCVGYIFEKKGVICLKIKNGEEENLIEDCFNYSALDCEILKDMAKVFVKYERFNFFVEKFKEKGYNFISARIEQIPNNFISINSKENEEKTKKLIEVFEEDEDVTGVWCNYKFN